MSWGSGHHGQSRLDELFEGEVGDVGEGGGGVADLKL